MEVWGSCRGKFVVGRDSGSGLHLCVQVLGLGSQALKLHLDEVRQRLPHFQLQGNLEL